MQKKEDKRACWRACNLMLSIKLRIRNMPHYLPLLLNNNRSSLVLLLQFLQGILKTLICSRFVTEWPFISSKLNTFFQKHKVHLAKQKHTTSNTGYWHFFMPF